MEPRHIASVSFGKDSLAMLYLLIARGWPVDEIVFFNNGMEFQAIYDTRDRVLPDLEALGIPYTELYPRSPFLYDMLKRPIKYREGRVTTTATNGAVDLAGGQQLKNSG